MPYGYIGSMRVREGHRDEVIAMLSVANGLRAADCQLYGVHRARAAARRVRLYDRRRDDLQDRPDRRHEVGRGSSRADNEHYVK